MELLFTRLFVEPAVASPIGRREMQAVILQILFWGGDEKAQKSIFGQLLSVLQNIF